MTRLCVVLQQFLRSDLSESRIRAGVDLGDHTDFVRQDLRTLHADQVSLRSHIRPCEMATNAVKQIGRWRTVALTRKHGDHDFAGRCSTPIAIFDLGRIAVRIKGVADRHHARRCALHFHRRPLAEGEHLAPILHPRARRRSMGRQAGKRPGRRGRAPGVPGPCRPVEHPGYCSGPPRQHLLDAGVVLAFVGLQAHAKRFQGQGQQFAFIVEADLEFGRALRRTVGDVVDDEGLELGNNGSNSSTAMMAGSASTGKTQQQPGALTGGDDDLGLKVGDAVLGVVERLRGVALGEDQQVIPQVLAKQLRDQRAVQRAFLASAQGGGQRSGGALYELQPVVDDCPGVPIDSDHGNSLCAADHAALVIHHRAAQMYTGGIQQHAGDAELQGDALGIQGQAGGANLDVDLLARATERSRAVDPVENVTGVVVVTLGAVLMATPRQRGNVGHGWKETTVEAEQGDGLRASFPAAVIEQQALFAHRGDAGFGLRPRTRVEKLDRRAEQITVADLAGISRGVDLLAHANPAEAICTSIQVFQLGFHFCQALDNRPELHA
ncbi:hypothetical protein Ddc_20901 [Ditylenchus destructor]|nr:hypothetical protein Ddc_20901 [Ditylenchus destructor]